MITKRKVACVDAFYVKGKVSLLIANDRIEKIGEPYRLTNRVLTGYLHADGKMTICEL